MHTLVLPYGRDATVRAADVIVAGGVVALPTETVYGLAGDATDAGAVAAIYAAKGRPGTNPLIIHVADVAAAEGIAVLDADARALAARFWPGPLTLVLPLREGAVATAVTAGRDTVAVRVPAHRAVQDVLAACGRPLAAPSANASNRVSPTTAAHVLATLGGRIPLVIDDGACVAGVESTILWGRRILRPGPVTADAIAAVVGQIDTAPDVTVAGAAAVSPGLSALHYAPRKPVRLDVTVPGADEWWIGFGPYEGDATLSAAGDLGEAAAGLFAALHAADAGPRPRIAVAPIPTHGIGAAINDRLRRAAGRG